MSYYFLNSEKILILNFICIFTDNIANVNLNTVKDEKQYVEKCLDLCQCKVITWIPQCTGNSRHSGDGGKEIKTTLKADNLNL